MSPVEETIAKPRVSFFEQDDNKRKKTAGNSVENELTLKTMMTFEGDDDLKSFDEEKDEDSESEEEYEEGSVESEDPVDIEPGARVRMKSNFFRSLLPKKESPTFHHFPRISLIPIRNNTPDSQDIQNSHVDDVESNDISVPSLKKNPMMKRLLIPFCILLLCLIITLSVVLRRTGPVSGNQQQNFTTSSDSPSFFYPSSAPFSSELPTLITKAPSQPSLKTTSENPSNIPSLPKSIPEFFTKEPTNTPSSQSPLSNSPSLQPSIHPTTNPNKRYDEIRVLLESMMIEFQWFSVFDDLHSPQYRSLEWIANGDSKALQLPSENTENDMMFNEAKSAIIQRWTISLLWFTLNGPEWKTNSKWLDNHHECEWYGIECNSTRVTKIVLNSNNLVGRIPSEIGYLEYLEVLKLRRNLIEGSIPSAIGSLQNLEELHLMSNSIESKIPTQIGQISKLVFLDLSKNKLIGNIPSEIGRLTHLSK